MVQNYYLKKEIANTYTSLKNTDKALEHYNEAYKVSDTISKIEEDANCVYDLAYSKYMIEKLSNIKHETQITAEMLKITSTGRSLKQTISDSQYHFGYVSLKD